MSVTLPRPPIRSTQKIRRLLFQLLVSMFVAVMFSLFFHPLNQQKQIATVDVSSMINRFVKTTANSKLPSDQLQKQVSAFGQALDSTLKTVAHDQQLILLPKEAVIAGTKDITDVVEATVNAQFSTLSSTPHKS